MSIFLRVLLGLGALGAFAVGNFVLFTMGSWTQDLPLARDLKTYTPPVMTRIHAGDGRLVKEFAYQHRVFVPEEEIPEKLINAFISAEDKTFFTHEGLDLKGMLRGTLGNAVRGRRIAGGSTITQQVVKNMLVGDARSIERKIREAFVARRLEQVFEKREILELYMNEIYLGGRYYGVGSASLNYFGKSLKDLSLAEAALLAAMPKAPGKVNPYRRPEAAVARRNWVLERMAVNGYITREEAEAAQGDPLTTVERLNSDEVRASAYFVEEVRREILRRAENGEIEGVDSEEPSTIARAEEGILEVSTLYRNDKDFKEFLEELRERNLLSRGHLEIVLEDEVTCEIEKLKDADCIERLYPLVQAMSDARSAFPTDMVMRLRKRLRNYKLLYEDGLSVRSTLDSSYQLAAQNALQNGLETYDRRHGFRGPVTSIEVEGGWRDKLASIRTPRGVDGWTQAVVVYATDERIAVALPDGERVSLSPEAIEWSKTRTDQKTGAVIPLKKGDVVYVSQQLPPDVLTRTVRDVVTFKPEDPWHLRQVPDVQGALVAMDPHTGRVLAMVGGYAFAQNQFNRAVQAFRQPGSSFKPVVYAAALDHGWTPADTVLDAPFVIETPQGLWKPGNYSAGRYYGESTLRLGIEKSRNLMTARLAQDVGMEAIAETARHLGIYPTPGEDVPEARRNAILGEQTYLSRSLGAGETTPLRMATAYGMMVNGGKQIAPVIIDRVQDRRGRTILQRDKRDCSSCDVAWQDDLAPPLPLDKREQMVDPITAYQSVSMMEGVVERGTATRVKAVGKHIAGKTGTTNDYVDAWFVGFSPDLVAAVWVGKDMAKSLGDGESGGRVSAPIFRDFMIEALDDKPDLEFRRPAGVRLVEVDARTGLLPGQETVQIIEEAFRPGTEPSGRDEDLDDFFRDMRRRRLGEETEGGFDPQQYARAQGASDVEGIEGLEDGHADNPAEAEAYTNPEEQRKRETPGVLQRIFGGGDEEDVNEEGLEEDEEPLEPPPSQELDYGLE